MTRAEAKRLGSKLAQAGVIDHPGVGGKLPKGLRETHGTAGIEGWWRETEQRRAPPRHLFMVCVDVAEAMIAGGWSLAAVGACSHTENNRRRLRTLEAAA